MGDLIDRNELLKVLEERKKPNNGGEDGTKERYRYMQWLTDYNAVKEAPTAELKVIHCKDCKWWDSTNGKTGYCHAAKHGYYSTHWEIHIFRTYDGEFYCADAERRTDE